MSGEEMKYIDEAFELNWIAPLGNNVNGFEEELAAYNNVKSVAVLSSGTSAIHLAIRLYDVGPEDTVFCSSLTFVASANPILYEHATPVLIDSEPETWNMSPEALERALADAKANHKLPKAVIVVHLYGQSAKMDELMAVCKKYGVPLIEDAAESLGSKYKGIPSGSIGDYGIYSFNGNKIITTSGGGALISNNEEAIQKARFLSTQARDPALHYQHSEVGYNYRMSNIVAGIGRGQLEVLDDRVNARRANFKRYEAAFADIKGIHFQPELKNTYSNRWLTALTVDPEVTGVTRTEIIERLEESNIEARPVWKPMHLQPLFEGVAYYPHEEGKSASDELFENGLCLPSGSNMTQEQQDKVIEIIKGMLEKKTVHVRE
ncbi:MAG TPA: aminotransferase class I/II-fold pyridoxal phosphate-dependent enzyme [Pseudogracilibacillus sp.]|nr:aminotransferase class I/II-fold pyridoxal phosphate-dependent enzyme [Pseudogracilibacillus sp.]